MNHVHELRAWARGDHGVEAAVDLLAAHGHWLRRRDFCDACVIATADHLVAGFDLPLAWLDFETAAVIADQASLPASDSERQILSLAAGLAGYPSKRPLHDLITGLDTSNLARVLDAIAHTAGWHEHRITPAEVAGHSHTVTGHFDHDHHDSREASR